MWEEVFYQVDVGCVIGCELGSDQVKIDGFRSHEVNFSLDAGVEEYAVECFVLFCGTTTC